MTELKEKQLEKIAGGTRTENEVTVAVDYSKDKQFSSDILIKPYLDGQLLTSRITTVDCSVTCVNIKISGRGKSQLKVKINNEIIKLYDINFDENSYVQVY